MGSYENIRKTLRKTTADHFKLKKNLQNSSVPLKIGIHGKCFPVNFAKFFTIPNLQNTCKLLLRVCVCVCVCVGGWVGGCVCLVFILFHLLVSFGCTTSVTYVRSSDQRSFVESISRGFCQAPSFLFVNYHVYLQRRKLQLTTTGEKTNDIMPALEMMIYIDIGYKSVHYKNRQ